PSISRRMKPTSSKSGATQTGVSSLRFRRAIGRSEAGGASKTFAHRKPRPPIVPRETHILESGPALRHRLEHMKGPPMVSDLFADGQLPPLEPLRVRKRVRRPESRHAVEVELVVERHVPGAAVPLERFDVIEPRFRTGQAELLLQDPRPGALGMLEPGELASRSRIDGSSRASPQPRDLRQTPRGRPSPRGPTAWTHSCSPGRVA